MPVLDFFAFFAPFAGKNYDDINFASLEESYGQNEIDLTAKTRRREDSQGFHRPQGPMDEDAKARGFARIHCGEQESAEFTQSLTARRVLWTKTQWREESQGTPNRCNISLTPIK